MLITAANLKGSKVEARDDYAGNVADVLFEDDNWSVRWLVVSTGHWLLPHHVLLEPVHIRPLDTNGSIPVLRVGLSRIDVEESPEEEKDLPVTGSFDPALGGWYAWGPCLPFALPIASGAQGGFHSSDNHPGVALGGRDPRLQVVAT